MVKKIFFFLTLLGVFTLQGCINDNEPDGPSVPQGSPLPDFSVVMNDGSVVSTSSLRGKVAVIVFFNTSCPDCQQELPVIQNLWDIYKDNPQVEIVPISREESAASIKAYWSAHNLSMPFSAQENRDVYSLFAPSIIPRVYIANPEGIIKAIFTDDPIASLNDLIDAINSVLPNPDITD